jgi:transposase
MVAPPPLALEKSAVRVKNDIRDAIALARLLRAGELTPIYVPDTEDEAMFDLTRARNDARMAARQAKQRLHSFLLRNECICHCMKKWTKTRFNCLAKLKMKHPAQQVAFQEYIDAVNECTERITSLDEQILHAAEEWRWEPTVKALQALRGVSLLTAVDMVAEIGYFNRFHNPRDLIAYLGLVPSEHSSNARIVGRH